MKKIIIVFIALVLMIFLFILFPVLKNNNYTTSIEKEIKKNYKLTEEIKYLNKYDLYYIILTTDNLIVLDNEYKEILKEEINKIKKTDKEIVYRLNQVMYEECEVQKTKIVYKYYNIYTDELIDTVEIGG